MSKYAKLVTEPVPQSEPLNSRQVKNNAGGFTFQLDQWARLDRFLILGSDSPTYYQKAQALTRENAKCVTTCFEADPNRTAQQIAAISTDGRASRNDAAIFALALGASHGTQIIRKAALSQLQVVCRTATHLFTFVDLVTKLKGGKGWGRMFKNAVASWYTDKPVKALAYQMIKYRERVGYTHKRLLQTAHPAAAGNLERLALYRWARGLAPDGSEQAKYLPNQVKAHIVAMKMADESQRLVHLVTEHKLPWEAVPTSATKNPDLWRNMLPDMGLTALLRNLGGMTQYGALKPMEKEVEIAVQRLTDEKQLAKARIHPFSLLLADAVYKTGRSEKGSRSWEPIAQIRDALEEAYYKAFKCVQPTGKRILIGLDVSRSMTSPLMGSPLTVAEGAAAMAMTVVRTEKNYKVMGFATEFRDLGITATMSLPEVLRKTTSQSFGGTDCALPMIYASWHDLKVDAFIVITDNETWAGKIHPVQALQEYRKKSGIPAKLVVVGMTSTGFSIAGPNDGGMLDVVGFDSNALTIIADFIRQS